MIAVGYTQRLELFRYLPSTSDENYSTSDGVMLNEETEKPFSGRLRTENDGRLEIYSYKNGQLNGQMDSSGIFYPDGPQPDQTLFLIQPQS